MSIITRGSTMRTLAAAVALSTGLTLAAGLPASATNKGTQSGNATTACAVDWNAHTIMDMDGVPGLDRDRDGNPVDYSNGGYVSEVSPAFGDPGFMEIQHWMGNNGDTSINWRIPVATSKDITGAKLTLTLPGDHGYAQDGQDLASWIMRWEKSHEYTNVDPSKVTVSGDVATVDIGDLAAGTGVIVAFGGTVERERMRDTFEATARLTGRYTEGDGCAVTPPPLPTVPIEGPCEQVVSGRTIMPVPARDITVRDMSGDGGRANADGWVSGPNRTFRLYGATDRDLTDVTYTATAAQGMTFAPGSADSVLSPGAGTLRGDGYTAEATGVGTPVISADGATVTLTVASMPARSSVSLNVTGVLDGTMKAMVIDEVMTGTQPACAAGAPDPEVTTARSEGRVDCTTARVPVTTVTTRTPYVFDAAAQRWVPGRPNSTSVTGTRPATAAELGACVVQPEPTPSTPVTPAPVTPAPTTPAPKPTTSTPTPTTPAPKPTTPTSPITPVATSAPNKPVKPGTPTTPKPRMVTRTFQVDRYLPRTAAQARAVAAFDNDGRLRYREDRIMWGHSRWQFVTVRVPVNATKAQVIKAINAKTTARIGDVRTTSRLATAAAGRAYVIAWELGKGATVKAAWGKGGKVAQTFFARS